MKQEKSRKPESDLSENEVLNKLLSGMTNSIDPHKIIFVGTNQAGKNIYKLAGKELLPQQAALLKEEAQVLQKMQLWNIFTETLRHEAHQRMWEGMKTLEDSHYGKTLLHAISIFETIVTKLVQVQPEKPPPHQYQPQTKLSPTGS